MAITEYKPVHETTETANNGKVPMWKCEIPF